MKTKTCTKCNISLTVDMFNANKSKKDGLQTQCRECQKKASYSYYNSNKQERRKKLNKQKEKFKKWWIDYKSKLKCCKCGEDHPATIDFHHTDPSTKVDNIANLAKDCAKNKLLIELGKCIVVCANCHRKLHYNEKTT